MTVQKMILDKKLPLEIQYEFHPATPHSFARVDLKRVKLGFDDVLGSLPFETSYEITQQILKQCLDEQEEQLCLTL